MFSLISHDCRGVTVSFYFCRLLSIVIILMSLTENALKHWSHASIVL